MNEEKNLSFNEEREANFDNLDRPTIHLVKKLGS